MKWKAKPLRPPKEYVNRNDWHRWFAWYPVRTINDYWVWWEWIEQKQIVYGFENWRWEYR